MNQREITTVKDLHEALDIPRPSIVRLLRTLEQIGYVKHAEGRGQYIVTEKVAELALQAPD
jgi:IclR family mhp operon transcriptional activator